MGAKVTRSIHDNSVPNMNEESKEQDKERNKQQVYQVLSSIPFGKVTSYGAVARLSGLGQGARFVGYVLRSLPKGSTLPWHRVLNSQGKISLPEDSPSFIKQITLLQEEGILVKSGKVDLKQHLWEI